MNKQHSLSLRTEINRLIETRNLSRAKELLNNIRIEDVSREDRHFFSALCRRINMNQLAMEFVWDNIFEAKQFSAGDVEEYANSLRKAGMQRQALRMLGTIPKTQSVVMAQAFCHITQWKYQDGLQCLLHAKDLQGNSPSDIISINLASCYTALNMFVPALELLESMLRSGIQTRNTNFYVNCLELQGQCLTRKGDYKNAKLVLEEAKATALAKGEMDQNALLIEKWLFINDLAGNTLDANSPRISELKKQVRAVGHWESLRHIDYCLALKRGDSDLYKNVYFGTPFKTVFLDSINLGTPPPVGKNFLWKDARHQESDAMLLDLYRPDLPKVPLGMTSHRLLLLLASDFYRPWSVGQLFDNLFPDEFFNPFSSKKRVQKLVKSIREALQKSFNEHELVATDYGYRLRPLHRVVFLCYPQMVFSSQEEFILSGLRHYAKSDELKIRDLNEIFFLSDDQWFRVLKKMTDAELITSRGQGKGKTYNISK